LDKQTTFGEVVVVVVVVVFKSFKNTYNKHTGLAVTSHGSLNPVNKKS
jgi:hypothetical protein